MKQCSGTPILDDKIEPGLIHITCDACGMHDIVPKL